MTGEKLSLDAALFLEQTNVADEPDLPTSRQTTGRINLNWLISPATSLQVAFQRSQQSAWQNHSQLLSGDLLNGGFSAALNFTIGPSSQLNVQTQFDRVAESTSSGQRADALRLNLSGAFALGPRFHINPFLGFSRMTDRMNGQHELLTNAYVSGEWFFILPRLSLSFAGSFNGSQLPGQGTSHLLNLDSGVNWYAFKLLAGGTLVISLRTLFVDGRVQGIDQSDFKVFVKADVAL